LKKIKVLVVDDSALMRKIISDMIEEDDCLEVIGTARNGVDMFEKLSGIHSVNMPDIITLDVEMPRMDGITALREMKSRNINIPTIVLSSSSTSSTKLTMDCLQEGAFDFIQKPSGPISLDINKVQYELIKKIKMSCSVENCDRTSQTVKNQVVPEAKRYERHSIKAVVIGASTGGPKALYSVITKLPKNIGVPTFVVQHMPVGFTKAFSERLDANSNQKVVEAEENMNIISDRVYIARGGLHMKIGRDRKLHLVDEPPIWGVKPAVDKLFESAAEVYGGSLVSVVLTGMGKDGACGTEKIKDKGGITIAEDKSTCTIYGMPKAAYETGKVDMVLKLDDIADKITNLVLTGRR
jgi:two-component system chemotaxis response regulator CheB